MVADDDPGILDVLNIMLAEIGGYDVTTTSNGQSVMDLREDYPDLFLLDLWMSGIDGREVCQHLKSSDKTKHIPVIIFSANRDVKTIAEAVGADDHLAKPFQMTELLDKVKRLI